MDRVLQSHSRFSGVELAQKLGVTSSYVGKLRGGWRPSRVGDDFWRRLESLDPEGARGFSGRVSESAPGYGTLVYRGRLIELSDKARAMMHLVVDMQAQIGEMMREGPPLSPPIAEVAAVERVSEQVAKRGAPAPRSRKKA